MQTTDSGIIVPESVDLRRREVWANDDWRLMRRVMRLCQQRGIILALICAECQEKKRAGAIFAPSQDAESGEQCFTCGCRHVQVRGSVAQ